MKTRIVCFAMMGLLAVAPVFGEDGEDREWSYCRIDASWYVGAVPLMPDMNLGPFTMNVTMSSPFKGTASVVWSGFDPTCYGACPTGVDLSIANGAVQRTGSRSFELTVITIVTDVLEQAVCIGKSHLYVDLDHGCHSGTMVGRLELYAPDQNPLGDDVPFACFPETLYEISKVSVDEPDPSCL